MSFCNWKKKNIPKLEKNSLTYGDIEVESCLVTGGKGFIGSHLVNFLKDKGHWVRSADIRATSFLDTLEDEFLLLDLRDFGHAMRVVEGCDWIFNLAANMGGIGYITELNAPIMRDNAQINLNILQACHMHDIKQVFFSSSACTYNRELQTIPNLIPLKEEDAIPAYPDSAYGWEKLFSEFLYKSFEHDYGIEVRIARFHNIYGPYCCFRGGQEKAPAALCRKVIEAKLGGTIEVWGDGKQTRSFLYIDDCLDAVYLLMQNSFSDPVNVGTDDLVSIDSLARLVMKIANKRLGIRHDLSKPQGVRGRNADLTLVKDVLGWCPKVSLKEGMERLYRWIESQLIVN